MRWLECFCLCAVIAVPVVALAGCEADAVNRVAVGSAAIAPDIPVATVQRHGSSARCSLFAIACTDAAAVATSRG